MIDFDQKRAFPPITKVAVKPGRVLWADDQLRGVLMRFDTNSDGRLSKEELCTAFKDLGSRAPGFRAFCALFRADRNHDGYVNDAELETLVKYVKNLGYIIN